MFKIIFWASVILLIYTYFGYLGLSILLGCIFKKKLPKAEIYPSVSIIVACYNEENVIKAKLDNLLSLEYPKDKLQILIASESTDKTNSIIAEYKNRGIELHSYAKRQGKTVILYKTIEFAKGEILLFTDANVMLKAESLKKIAANFCTQSVGAVSGRLIVNNPKASNISWGESVYKKYETALRKANSRLGKVLNPDGAIFAIRKNLYRPISPKRGDDFELVIRTLIAGYDSVFEQDAISFEKASLTAKAEIGRKIRMVSWFLRSSFILLKEMVLKPRPYLIFQLISHKLLRWFSPYLLIALFVTTLILCNSGWIYHLSMILEFTTLIMGILGFFLQDSKNQERWPTLAFKLTSLPKAAYYFLVFNYAFLIGTIKGLLPEKSSAFWDKTRD